jgi:hypothetical protein
MARRTVGPRRTDSLGTYVRATRIIGGVSVLVLSGAVAWDFANDGFWSRHALFTTLVASLIVVAVTVAVLNEVLERRQRQRWSVLAQYALFDLVRTARLVWTGLLELAALVPDGEFEDGGLAAGSEAVLDTPRLAAAIDEMLAAEAEPSQPSDSSERAGRGRMATRQSCRYRAARGVARSELVRTRDADRPARMVGYATARPTVDGSKSRDTDAY